MAREDVAAQVKNDLLFLHESFWQDQVQGVLLYGSVARSDAGPRSDIDLCIVAPEAADKAALWREFISHIRDNRYDVRIFELLPLHIKIAVIEEGLVVYARDILELYEYFYPFRREWEDQKHRQEVSREEMRDLIQASRRVRASGRC
jgi:predicted nucleotidyltransferase